MEQMDVARRRSAPCVVAVTQVGPTERVKTCGPIDVRDRRHVLGKRGAVALARRCFTHKLGAARPREPNGHLLTGCDGSPSARHGATMAP